MCSPGSTQSEGWYRKSERVLSRTFWNVQGAILRSREKLAKKFQAKNIFICWYCFYVCFCFVGNFLANAALSNFKVQTSPENCSQQVSKAGAYGRATRLKVKKTRTELQFSFGEKRKCRPYSNAKFFRDRESDERVLLPGMHIGILPVRCTWRDSTFFAKVEE